MANEFFINWVDEDGVETRSSMYVDATDPALQPIQNLIAALGAVSAAGISKYGITISEIPDPAIPAAVGGAFDQADKLVLEGLDSNGKVASITYPAPKGSLLDDSDTVSAADLAGATITGFWAAIAAVWEYDGATLTTPPLRGYRIRTARHDVA